MLNRKIFIEEVIAKSSVIFIVFALVIGFTEDRLSLIAKSSVKNSTFLEDCKFWMFNGHFFNFQ